MSKRSCLLAGEEGVLGLNVEALEKVVGQKGAKIGQSSCLLAGEEGVLWLLHRRSDEPQPLYHRPRLLDLLRTQHPSLNQRSSSEWPPALKSDGGTVELW